MDKCFWCNRIDNIYAFDLCYSCYRFSYRHPILSDLDYCMLCGKFITKRSTRNICKDCNCALKSTSYVPKRLEHLETKFKVLQQHLEKFDNKEQAFAILSPAFKPKQLKFLDALLDRYYNKVTLQHIADQWGASREYIRQCENKALHILLCDVFLQKEETLDEL